MKNSILILLLLLTVSSCAKKSMTTAKVKLKVSGIINLANGIGNGGGVLYGRSSTGEIFGHVILNNEENLELPNGDWSFYAFMWDTAVTSPAAAMIDNAYCGKSLQKLSGTSVSIAMNLSNANCADPEFSNGKTYIDGLGKNRFADIFLEDCDELNVNTNFTCGLANQGSALSYRVIVRSFKKNPAATDFSFGAGVITSACQTVDRTTNGSLQKGLPVNFPSGNGSTPFVVGVEMFLGNATCDTTDPKGVFTTYMNQGFGAQNPSDDKIIVSSNTCAFVTSDFAGTPEEIKNKCEDFLGMMNTSLCNAVIPATISKFAPAVSCASSNPSAVGTSIKHLVTIPKSFLCDRYLNQSAVVGLVGAHPFAGGNGTSERPYKICTEWQINQIGEVNSVLAFSNKFYKLMNDLDMNKTDFGPYAKPQCVGVTSSLVDRHHNFNPLDKISHGACTTVRTTENNGFQGSFDGNLKTISNARIEAKTINGIGFTRSMFGGAVVKNLNFKFLEVRGASNIGGITGAITGTNALIRNIQMDRAGIEGESQNGTGADNVGAVVGTMTATGSNIINAQVNNSHVRGRNYIGGIVGQLQGGVSLSKFRGEVETSDSSGVFAGGLVGYASTSATINDSYTEGSISASTQNIAGIAAFNGGSINRVYSTMAVIPKSMNSGTAMRVGGIIADFPSGSLSDAYFDGFLYGLANLTPTPLSGGVIANLGSATSSSCFSTQFGITAGASCTGPASIRTGSVVFSSTPITTTYFNQLAGSIPRLKWELRECLDPVNQQIFSAQITNQGRGSAANPLVICTSSQLSSISGRSSTEFYRIAEDINLSDWNATSSLVAIFNGNLEGAEKILYGLNISPADTTTEAKGMIKTVAATAKINQLHLYGNKIISTAATNATSAGILAGENFGELKNINIKGSTIDGTTNVALVAGHNDGTIIDSVISDCEVKGNLSVGAVAGFADINSSIKRNDVQTKMSQTGASTFTQFGGIVGFNKGSIDQTRFSGDMTFTTPTAHASGPRIGGLVGYNLGIVTNSYVDNWSTIKVNDTQKVGGLVGENDGVNSNVNRSFNLGKVIYNNNAGGIATGNLHPLVSVITDGTVASDNYFLENKIGSLLGANSTSTCSGSGPFQGTVTTPSITYLNAGPLADRFLTTNGGGSLSTMVPMTVPAADTFAYTFGTCLPALTNVEFYKSYVVSLTQSRSIAQMGNINTFCSGGWIGSEESATCATGYDIIGIDTGTNTRYGENRMIEYYKSIMYNTPTPANAPVWELDQDGHPRLLQLEHF